MKKVLLTSTALMLASAGVAAAEITLSGTAKMGIAGGNFDWTQEDFIESVPGSGDFDTAVAGTEADLSADLPAQFFQDIDVTFTMSGETDGGITFGASVDLDEAGNLGNEFDDQGVAIFISGTFGTVTLGDTDGALDAVIPETGHGSGSMNDAETSHFGYLGSWLDGSGDNQVVRYDYNFDAFQFSLSLEQGPTGANGLVLEDDDDLTWAIGFGYDYAFNGGVLDLGIGYQYSDAGQITFSFGQEDEVGGLEIPLPLTPQEASVWSVGGLLTLDNGFDASLIYSAFDFDDFDDTINHWQLGAGYAWDAWSIGFNYGTWRDGGDELATGYGLSAGYDLGGGASLLFGYGFGTIEDVVGVPDDTVAPVTQTNYRDVQQSAYSLGLVFSF